MPFHPNSEQKKLIRQLIIMGAEYRLRMRLNRDYPIAIKMPQGADHLWCEQIEQILANHKIYISEEGDDV